MSTIIDANTAVDTLEFDRLVASTVRAMRQSLRVTVAQLAKASGVPGSNIEDIECGGPSTRAERYDIAVAVEWLSNNCAAKRLTMHHQPVPSVEES